MVVITAVLFGVFYGGSDKTGSRNILDVNLNALARILHLLIGFGNVFRIRQLYRPLVQFAAEPGRGLKLCAYTPVDAA
ncbi:MAG: hypothetical protein II038_14900 [Lachnospiraceae bacterium]|nr:hypothetical protein [Lachnospiraceae bacterium]